MIFQIHHAQTELREAVEKGKGKALVQMKISLDKAFVTSTRTWKFDIIQAICLLIQKIVF